MAKIKTGELIGKALDWAVALSEGATDLRFDTVASYWFTLNGVNRVLSSGWSASQNFCPSTNWAQGGPILETHGVGYSRNGKRMYANDAKRWEANRIVNLDDAPILRHGYRALGPTPLVAGLRCLVRSKLGEEVEIPMEILE